ncbi:hypothetical protein [Pseudomonas fluorescens]|nr:hypothetical protein [Pseudomonas fluorescens]
MFTLLPLLSGRGATIIGQILADPGYDLLVAGEAQGRRVIEI